MAQQSASKNNFYFWQLEIESIKDDPDRMVTSVISQELTVRHLLHYIAVHPSLHDDQLPPDLRPPPPSRSGRGSGHQPDGERSKTGSGGVRDDAGHDKHQSNIKLSLTRLFCRNSSCELWSL